MENKHTAGPWKLGEIYKTDIFQDTNTGIPKWICTPGTTEPQMSKQEQLANAKLIAAAPDLLEACMKTLQYFKNASDAGKYPEFLLQENGGEGFQYLEQAIQKALTL